MAEENNKTIVLALVAAIVISLGGTFLVLNKLDKVGDYPVFTGFATNDTGYVNVTISQTLSIDVNDTDSYIDFGTCNAPKGGLTTSIASNFSQGGGSGINATQQGGVANGDINCTGGNLIGGAKYIKIQNIGNVEANLTINSTHNGTNLLTSGDAKIWYNSVNHDVAGLNDDCTVNRATGWNEIILNQTLYVVCERLSFGNPNPAQRVYLNLTIPFDSSTGGLLATSTLTFEATQNAP